MMINTTPGDPMTAAHAKATKIPAALRDTVQWVCWRRAKRDGKLIKLPINPRTGEYGKVSVPETWSDFATAVEATANLDLPGVGFVFAKDDGFAGIDLDDCRDKDSGAIAPWARAIMEKFNSYTEVSPSGTGIKIFIKGKKPKGNCRVALDAIRKLDYKPAWLAESTNADAGEIEIYDHGRFFCVTGMRLDAASPEVESRQAELNELCVTVFGADDPECVDMASPADHVKYTATALADNEIVDIASRANNGDKFQRLYRDGVSLFGDASRDDMSLCCLIAAYSKDPEQISRIFRSSALYRPKWDEKHYSDDRTYGQVTAARAVEKVTFHYERLKAKKSGKTNDLSTMPNIDDISQAMLAAGILPFTDLGNAERLVAVYGQDLRFCYEFDSWLVWNGKRWVKEYALAEQLAKAVVRTIKNEVKLVDAIQYDLKDEERDNILRAIRRHARVSESSSRIRAMLALAQSELLIPVRPEELDANPWLLNVANSTVDLKSGVLLPHTREALLTKMSCVPYEPDAPCERWRAFLTDIMRGDEAMIAYLHRVIGYTLTGNVSEQCLFFLWGVGSNGKSTFTETVLDIMGDYAQKTPSELLLEASHSGGNATPEIANLHGCRLAIASEIGIGRRWSESRVKDLTGNDQITARRLYEDAFTFRPTHKLAIFGNYKPAVQGQDNGIWRRMRLIPFEACFEGDSRDPGLRDKLREELPGILAWAIRGCLAWQRERLGEPAEVISATKGYREEMDTFGEYLSACCVVNKALRATAKELYRAYSAWAEENGEWSMSQTMFGRILQERGFGQCKNGQGLRVWKGLGLKADTIPGAYDDFMK